MGLTHVFSALIIAIVLSGKAQGQDFNSLTSQIFLNIDVNNHDTSLVSSLKSKPELTFKPQTGWTVYPPKTDKGDPALFYMFSFARHPYFTPGAANGRMMVVTDKDSKTVIGLTLSLSFNSQSTFDSVYTSLKKLYTTYSSKSIKRPNIGEPFEVTKFLSKGGNNYMIITKGESDGKPYLHFAYNHQDYEW